MPKKIKSIKRFNQNFRNFNFSDLTSRADDEFLELEISMDENGNTLEEIKYMNDGSVEEKNSYTYDKNNKLISHVLFYELEDVTQRRVLSRDEKGNALSEEKFYGDDSGEKTLYEYDGKDNITKITYFDEEGELSSYVKVTYDEKGDVIEKVTFDAKNNQTGKNTYSKPADHQIEEIEFDGSEKMIAKTLIKFTEDGKELSTIQTNPTGKLISGQQNIYDEKGNIIKRIYKDFYSKSLNYSYNEKDQLTSQELFDDNGSLLRKNIFEYDEEGNVSAEQTYEMDTSRGGRDKHYGIRYEYTYY
jgi:hypothetical protein